MRFFHILPLLAWEPYIAEYPDLPIFEPHQIQKITKEIRSMTEKNYFLNIYNTMTGEFELVQVTKEVFRPTGGRNGTLKTARNAFTSTKRR